MYRRISDGWVKHLDFMLLDLICLQLSFVLAYCVRHGLSNPYEQIAYRNIGLFLMGADAVLLLMSGQLSEILRRGVWREFKSCLFSTVVISMMSATYLFAIQGGQGYSRLTMAMTAAFYLVVNFLMRCLWKRILQAHGGSRTTNSMLVAANQKNMRTVLRQLRSCTYGLPTIVGLVLLDEPEDSEIESVSGIPVVATQHNLEEYICANWVDELLIATDNNDLNGENQRLNEQLDLIAASGVVVHRTIGMGMRYSGRNQLVEQFAGYMVLTDSVKIVSLRQALLKRAIDILGGIVGCVIAGIALLIVGPAIYIQSPGPVIFKQKRVGRNGKVFTIYKMRSMVMDAEKRKQELMEQNRVSDGLMFKLEFDPRIIGSKMLPNGAVKKGIGNYIRDWSIDELPQFFNVLKGDMSLVGTRPPTLDEWEKYELHHRARMAFRPGITGMWQVSGRSEITNFEDVVKLDMQYISGWNIGLDFKILLKTVQVVLGRKGAM